MKVIIAGGRDFDNYQLLCETCDKALSQQKEIEIVCGGARGADKLGERYAKEKGFSIKYFPAEWEKYGKSAGYRRNEDMAKYGDALIAFWDSISKGTKHMIETAGKHGLKIKIIKY